MSKHSSESLRVAIVGAGRVGNIRSVIIEKSRNSTLAMVADVDTDKAQTLARETGAVICGDWREVCADNTIDAVVVSTPTRFHEEIVVAALRAGKHVLCEKPLGRTAIEARAIYDAALDSRKTLKIGFNYRHMAHVRKARELLDASSIGELYFLRCRYGHGGRPGYEKEWCTHKEWSGGGVLLEQGIHIFDLVRHLLGEPARLVAQTRCFFWDFDQTEDNGFCLLESNRHWLAQVHISWTQWLNIFELEIFGSSGYLRLEGRDGHYGQQRLIWGKRNPNHTRPDEARFDFPEPDRSWELEWEEFCSAIRESREPMGSAADGLRAQQLVESAYCSAAQATWIELPEPVFEEQRPAP